MTTMTPAAARAFWLALLDNAARIVVEADMLFPSPRAQSLVVLAQEEVGKAIWVHNAFRSAWGDGDATPSEVPELRQHARRHIPKLMQATDFWTAMIDVPDGTGASSSSTGFSSSGPIEVEVVREHAPEFLVAYHQKLAHVNNQAKQRGFYVDLDDDGTFTVPHEIDRPELRGQIWEVADMVQWCLDDDAMRASLCHEPRPPTEAVAALIKAVLARGPDG
ncbi:AbiV family abortive infection protein [Cellulomonas sp. P24]|uniref:AbiV family abortive infection protein n=1 Tax=Cellulomonas sp. P24 TaxID=2885206 RepID=UPI00216B19E6|nr:AbiV family abortive infection protein [Cellulomonas sp. P24]MCR6492968.1 AbiV family abortive infection protein [Cellulomonas sp. P24]